MPNFGAARHRRPIMIILAVLAPVGALLPAAVFTAGPASAAASAGYTASFIPIGGTATPVSLAIDTVTNTFYIQEFNGPDVSDLLVIDGSTHKTEAVIPLTDGPRAPIAVNTVTDTIYVLDGNGIEAIDGATNEITATIPVHAVDFAVDSSTNTIYAATQTNVTVINGASNTVTGTLSAGNRPGHLAIDEATGVVWVQNLPNAVGGQPGPQPVVAISEATGAIVQSINVPSQPDPDGIAVNPATNTVYDGGDEGALVVIDGASGTVTATIPVSSSSSVYGPMVVDTATDTLFVRGFAEPSGANGLIAIDGQTNTVTDILITASGQGAVMDQDTGVLYETSAEDEPFGLWAITPSASNEISPLMSGPTTGTAIAGQFFQADSSFNVFAGSPGSTITETGKLPDGVTLNSSGLLSGTPAIGTQGTYPITVIASNGVAPDFSLPFTLTVEPPVASSPSFAVAVLDPADGGVPFAQAPQLGTLWQSLGGKVISTPAVAAPPNPDGAPPAPPLFIAPGVNHSLYIRGVTGSWTALGPNDTSCMAAGAVITSTAGADTLTVACETTSHSLSVNSAPMPSSGLPQFTSAWRSLGGSIAAAPAVTSVGGVITFIVLGNNGKLYDWPEGGAATGTSWSCLGAPAAAQQPVTGTTVVACQGANHALYSGTVTSAGLSGATRAAGTLSAGPAIAAASGGVTFLVVGTNDLVYTDNGKTATALPGLTAIGVEAAALN
jgi:DNA-binding beta-propeller fold protein YncE